MSRDITLTLKIIIITMMMMIMIVIVIIIIIIIITTTIIIIMHLLSRLSFSVTFVIVSHQVEFLWRVIEIQFLGGRLDLNGDDLVDDDVASQLPSCGW